MTSKLTIRGWRTDARMRHSFKASATSRSSILPICTVFIANAFRSDLRRTFDTWPNAPLPSCLTISYSSSDDAAIGKLGDGDAFFSCNGRYQGFQDFC